MGGGHSHSWGGRSAVSAVQPGRQLQEASTRAVPDYYQTGYMCDHGALRDPGYVSTAWPVTGTNGCAGKCADEIPGHIDQCKSTCTANPSCAAFAVINYNDAGGELKGACTEYTNSCFSLDRPTAPNATLPSSFGPGSIASSSLYVNYARTPQVIAEEMESASFASGVSLDSSQTTPGTLFVAMDSNRDSLIDTDEAQEFMRKIRFGSGENVIMLKGGFLSTSEIKDALIKEIDTHPPAGLVDFREFDNAFKEDTHALRTESGEEVPDTLAVNRKLEQMAYAVLGLPKKDCPVLESPAPPPTPAAPPCSPPPPATCGPWEEADGRDENLPKTDMQALQAETFEECMQKCCALVADGYEGVQYLYPTCNVFKHNPIYNQDGKMRNGFKQLAHDYGTKKEWQSASLLIEKF